MNRLLSATLTLVVVLSPMTLAHRAAAQYAEQVVSFSGGSTASIGFGFASSALGEPSRFTADISFPSVVSPFNPPFSVSQIVSIGEGGQITLRLSHFAVPQAAGPEIGVFTNAGMIETSFPDGVAGDPVGTFGVDSAEVSVSEDGLAWTSLGNVTFDMPTNAYTDLTTPFANSPGNSLSDFQQPFTGSVDDFTGLTYHDAGGNGILDLLASSGGGTWLDISGTGLAKVGYVRFAVADDSNSGTSLNFELDAVSVSHAAMGHLTVPEPATIALVALALVMMPIIRRRRN
jgi:hypothetical protein